MGNKINKEELGDGIEDKGDSLWEDHYEVCSIASVLVWIKGMKVQLWGWYSCQFPPTIHKQDPFETSVVVVMMQW